jgi:hypothetical protein
MAAFLGDGMGVDEFFHLRARLVERARSVDADTANIGVLSTGDVCAVALLLGGLDLLNDYKHPLDALERLGPEWEKAVRDLHISSCRR